MCSYSGSLACGIVGAMIGVSLRRMSIFKDRVLLVVTIAMNDFPTMIRVTFISHRL